jgi:uncharacterized protein YbjT (DUF2867 family)
VPHESFRVLVADAATTVGRALVSSLATTEYEVRALVTTPAQERAIARAGADDVAVAALPPTASATASDALADAVADVDAICCTVEDRVRDYLTGRLTAGEGVRALLDAVTDATPYVVLHSRIGVADSAHALSLPRRILTYRLRRSLAHTERHLRETGHPHTIVRTDRVTTDDADANRPEASDVPEARNAPEVRTRDPDAREGYGANDHQGRTRRDLAVDADVFRDPPADRDASRTDGGAGRSPDKSTSSADGRHAALVEPRHDHDVVTTAGDDAVAAPIAAEDLAWVMTAALTTPAARNRTFAVVDADATTAEGIDVDWRGPETGFVARRTGYSIPS